MQVEQEEEEERRNGPQFNEKGEQLYSHSRASRREIYEEMAEEKIKDDKIKNPDKYKPKKPLSRKFTKKGKVRMCNEGGYKFHLNEYDEAEWTSFTMMIPKFCDTSLIEVDIKPTYVSVRVKKHLTQLRFEEEVILEGATIKRSQLTGELVIRAKKLKPNYVIANAIKRDEDKKIKERVEKKRRQKEEDEKILRLIEQQEQKLQNKS
jgi:protein TilB